MITSFLGIDIEYDETALRPRAETELLARTALAKAQLLAADGHALRAIDVCCGTGNVACALAVKSPNLAIVATDLTDGCVAWARKNALRLALANRVAVVQGDLFINVPPGPYDLITCNPPYISTGKLEGREDLKNEPREAFDGGPYGVTIHQRVAREALPLLRAGGWLCFEFGLGQEKQLELVIKRAGGYDTVEFSNDENGAPRVVAVRKAS